MAVSFLSPWSALIGLAGVLPLAAFLRAERRAERVAGSLGLPHRRAPRLTVALALVLVAALVGAAAAEPVVDRNLTRHTRTDAEAFFVFDISRSMLARGSSRGATRLERAKTLALRLRAALPDIKVGVASMTDRTLPHLFPTSDQRVFRSVVTKAIGIERPPPIQGDMTRITTLTALSAVAVANFFSRAATHRLLVFFSDTESSPFDEQEVGRVFRQQHIRTLFVRFWYQYERIYVRANLPEAGYQPDPASALYAEALAALTGGRSLTESQFPEIVSTARRFLGSGPAVAVGQEHGKYSLAPYAALLGVLPLGFLLWRRNF